MEEVSVLVSDLEKMQQVLLTMHHFSVAHDLTDNYQQLRSTNIASPLSKLIRANLDRVEGYLSDAEEESGNSED